MCHALTTKGKPCRNPNVSSAILVTTQEPIPDTFHTGFCMRHLMQLQHEPVAIWRYHHCGKQFGTVPVVVRLEAN